jgi:23S rRNA pseudouridine2605 synthase
MARNNQSGKAPRSNRKTDFGKKTRAEKDFRKKPTRRSSEDERPGQRPSSPAALGFTKKGKSERSEQKHDRPYGASGNSMRSGPRQKKTFGSKPTSKDRSGFASKSFSPRPESSTSKPSFRKGKFDPSKKEDRPYRSTDKSRRTGAQDKRSSAPRRTSRDKFDVPPKSFVQSRIESSSDKGSFKKSIHNAPKKDDGLIRLNKYIANSGVGSRREADNLISMGLISVNGKTITEMGFKVKLDDEVRYENKILRAEKSVYILLNKPKGFLTTTQDPQERNTVMGLVAKACKERVYPVGRLDRNTTGLLLLTNDGDLADKLTHPSYNAKKVYKVDLDRPLTKNDFQRIIDGVQLEEGKALVDDLALVSDDKKTVGIELHIGWNRIVRRIFEALGYEVVKLDRVVYAGLDKKDLPRGHWRFLKPEEIIRLKHFN